jgi:hypothetical protein
VTKKTGPVAAFNFANWLLEGGLSLFGECVTVSEGRAQWLSPMIVRRLECSGGWFGAAINVWLVRNKAGIARRAQWGEMKVLSTMPSPGDELGRTLG